MLRLIILDACVALLQVPIVVAFIFYCLKSSFMRPVEKFQRRKMKKFSFGELFEKRTSSSSRNTRSSRAEGPRKSYNEDLIAPSIDDSGDYGVPHPSVFPCTQFLDRKSVV